MNTDTKTNTYHIKLYTSNYIHTITTYNTNANASTYIYIYIIYID